MGLKEDIDILDSKVTRLKTEYEQYFMGILKREPVKLREDVERRLLRHHGVNITSTALRFKLESIIARFTSYKQYWTRVLRAIEEGTYMRRAETSYMRLNPSAPPSEAGELEKPAPREEAAETAPELPGLYEKYVEARKTCNEPIGVTYEKFAETLKKSVEKAKEAHHVREEDIEVEVLVKDGKTKVVIKPKGR